MMLDEIGFYTMEDARAKHASVTSPLWRCELVLGARCNFHCPYCRTIGGKDLPYEQAADVVRLWAAQGLRNIRFSGGEPTMFPYIIDLVRLSRDLGIRRIALSTNGSAPRALYWQLIKAGMDDASVSLDACCAEDGDKMAGGIKGAFDTITENIRWLAARIYTTAGVVLTPDNLGTVNEIIRFADTLGVSDIRIIPAAQDRDRLSDVQVDDRLLAKYPILRYRIRNLQNGRQVRGLTPSDPTRCPLVLDDMAVNQGKHFPCIIYMRESGSPIGNVGPNMRAERQRWAETHDTQIDPICKQNCLDVCIDYNRAWYIQHKEIAVMPTTFRQVGEEVGLLPVTLSRYVAYMLIRWAHRERDLCSTYYANYAREWALRFRDGEEYQESDRDGIAVLKSIDGGCDDDQAKVYPTKTEN